MKDPCSQLVTGGRQLGHNLDTAVRVRPGEELPIDALEATSESTCRDCAGPLAVEQFPHGHSNLTYLLRCGDRELVLRRPPFGNQVKTAHDMGREYRVLSKLCAVYPPAPRPYLYCEDAGVLGRSVLRDGTPARGHPA